MTIAYAADLNLWAQQTAGLLREKRWNEIDLEHLAEELEDLSKSETGLPLAAFPASCLYPLPQILAEEWLPD